MRANGRKSSDIRNVKIIRNFIKYPEGSVLIELGNTKVICTASVEETVPPFLKDSEKGWITAEYSLLPRSTHTRTIRDAVRGRIGGRSYEIQRLIGKSLRAVTDLEALMNKTIWIDCDVIQADGGTRTASITGSYVALADAFRFLMEEGKIKRWPLKDFVAAISVGIVDGEILLDLDYEEDSRASVDMNFVATGEGLFIEIQGTAEGSPFSYKDMKDMSDMAMKGINILINKQKEILNI
jgi:ribonuclease PH